MSTAQWRKRCAARFADDARFKQIESAVAAGQPLSAADRAYYLQRIEPYLRRYERLVQRPSAVSAERSADTPFPELAGMRRIARAEAYLMREELRQKRYRAAIARAERLTRLAEQARNGGPLIHYLVGNAIHSIALRPIREELPRIQDRAALEALLTTRPRLRETAHAPVEMHAGGILLRAERPPRYCRRAHGLQRGSS
jgi:hypothetical protein